MTDKRKKPLTSKMLCPMCGEYEFNPYSDDFTANTDLFRHIVYGHLNGNRLGHVAYHQATCFCGQKFYATLVGYATHLLGLDRKDEHLNLPLDKFDRHLIAAFLQHFHDHLHGVTREPAEVSVMG
jgi:hypothetical protein